MKKLVPTFAFTSNLYRYNLLRVIVAPVAAALYRRTEIFASSLDHHHSFVVHYANKGGDLDLDMHHDASEVTLNVCLGKEFTGAGLRFCGRFGGASHRKSTCVLSHVPGRAVMHLGRQRHGADSIASGERLNLILWARSSVGLG